jgi:hypothetical protein
VIFSSMASVESADALNAGCFCITGDVEHVHAQLRTAGQAGRWEHLVSSVPVFVSRIAMDRMLATVEAIERTVRLPAISDRLLAAAPPIARADRGPAGAFMGYDFHVEGDVPRLIEVNTNAGGAMINARLADAQRACCDAVSGQVAKGGDDFEAAVVAMFEREWRRQRGSGRPERIAIVDDSPEQQFLYPEFVETVEILERAGIEAVIADPLDLKLVEGRLLSSSGPVDLVYNRTTDFMLEEPEHDALRRAFESGASVVTPNPHNHALFANKKNLVLLSDPAALRDASVPEADIAALATVPRTVIVDAGNADTLWEARRGYFFKPVSGYGSKAVYRGDKLTRTVWAGIVAGGYVAQELAPAGRRSMYVDGRLEERKADVRLYCYEGAPLLAAARLYQGQTTNFRTPGGGFAPVYLV